MSHFCIQRVFAIPADWDCSHDKGRFFSLALDCVIIPKQREYMQGYIQDYLHLLRKCDIVFALRYFLLQPVEVIQIHSLFVDWFSLKMFLFHFFWLSFLSKFSRSRKESISRLRLLKAYCVVPENIPRRVTEFGGEGVQKGGNFRGGGVCLQIIFFPGGLSKIGELLINNSISVEQAFGYFFYCFTVFKTSLIICLDHLLRTVGKMLFSRLM